MVTTRENVFEIEVDGPRNECLMFGPIGRRIRGRFDLNRIAEPQARLLTNRWPVPLPGQRLGIDLDSGVAYVAEPLHGESAMVKKSIAQAGFELAPEREEITGAHLPTWLFWLRRAVESGVARLTRGKLPETIEGTPQKEFITKRPEGKTRDEAFIESMNANTAVLQAILKKLSE